MAISFDMRAVFIGLTALAFALQDAPTQPPAGLSTLFQTAASNQPCALAQMPEDRQDGDITGAIGSSKAHVVRPICP